MKETNIKLDERKVRWAMVIDLRKCIGCGACTLVCSQTNKIPSNLWRKIIDCGINGPPGRERLCLPISCMHCGKPPCLEVCPTGATYLRLDGIVDIRYEQCIGCGYCIVACPYMARSIIFDNGCDFEDVETSHISNKNVFKDAHIGVSSKCNFCLPRIESGLTKGLRPGLDPEASPLCVISCSAGALSFGNVCDINSEVSRLIKENKTVFLQEELGTDPSIYYITE
jgi:phenylacetyl-CoA:acceptor oxidoreductase 27-kDa subunit